MEEWVHNDLYESLIQKPLWVCAAFGTLKEGEVIDAERSALMYGLILETMGTCPEEFYDTDYYNTWKLESFVSLFKGAVRTCRACKTCSVRAAAPLWVK